MDTHEALRAAEEPPPQEQQPRRGPADVERGPELPLLRAGQDGVVEITDNGAGAPADGNEHQEACDDEDDAGRHGHFALFPLVLHEVGALAPDRPEKKAEDAGDDGDDGEGSGGLQVRRQGQERVVHLALHLTRTLGHAVHPQALPDHLGRDDVGADEGGDFPRGESAHDDAAQEAEGGEGQTQELASGRHHAGAGVLLRAVRRGRRLQSAACRAPPAERRLQSAACGHDSPRMKQIRPPLWSSSTEEALEVLHNTPPPMMSSTPDAQPTYMDAPSSPLLSEVARGL
ncbi:hypothetical protein EYF80_041507 [Liparis tanakae]|uniref:Uncharacterized protein n=1 Tax=Liparis tanakae TaxID=230148 RepID=A0A4Z2G3Z3_9TELE|nr:hypothetical protein EYF80_041507 [Liparis tanakae]